MNKENGNAGTVTIKQQVASFGTALLKVYTGTATAKDWITVLKLGLPVLLGGALFSISIFVLIIALVLGPIDYVQQLVGNAVQATASFFEQFGNWISGNGWADNQTAFNNIIKSNQGALGCKNSSLVTATVMYYYQIEPNAEANWGDASNIETEETTENEEDGSTVTTEINYGQLLPDLKRLSDKIKSGDSEYEKYVKDTFLEQDPYKKLLEGFTDKDKRKDDIFSEMESIAKAIPCENTMSGLVCYGEYSDSGTVDIDLQDLNNVYVNLANCSCEQGSLETCNSWQYENISFKDYIMGVVWAESYSKNLEAVKAQTVAAKSYTIGRIKSMGRTWHEVDGKYVVYMKNCTDDQVFAPITTGGTITERNGKTRNVVAASAEDQALLSQAYDETFNDFIWDGEYFAGPYCEDFGECSFCNQGTCMSQSLARTTTNQSYKEILGYHYSDFSLLDLSTKTIKVSTVSCPAVAGTGQIRLPIDEGLYTVTSPFGPRVSPGGRGSTNHKGIDMGATQGIPIYAIAPGKVIFSGLSGGYGKLVTLAHDIDADGKYDYYTLYAHCSELFVDAREEVGGGIMIAKVGNTGTSTGPHLHFEIREGENNSYNAKNPQPFLDDIKAGTSVFNQMIRTEKKYYNQGDYSNVAYCPGMYSGDKVANLQTSGCLPTSFAMVVAALKDSTVTPTVVANHICNNYVQYRVEGSGTNGDILNDKNFLSHYSIQSTHVTSDYENQIRTALEDNKIIIVNVRGGTFNPSGAGHYFVLSGINSDGTVSVYDPGSKARTKNYSIADVIQNVGRGIWIFE